MRDKLEGFRTATVGWEEILLLILEAIDTPPDKLEKALELLCEINNWNYFRFASDKPRPSPPELAKYISDRKWESPKPKK